MKKLIKFVINFFLFKRCQFSKYCDTCSYLGFGSHCEYSTPLFVLAIFVIRPLLGGHELHGKWGRNADVIWSPSGLCHRCN